MTGRRRLGLWTSRFLFRRDNRGEIRLDVDFGVEALDEGGVLGVQKDVLEPGLYVDSRIEMVHDVPMLRGEPAARSLLVLVGRLARLGHRSSPPGESSSRSFSR